MLLEVGGGFPALLFTSGPIWAGLEHSAGNRRLSAVMCMSSSRSNAKGRLVAFSMAARVGGGKFSAVQSMRRQFIRQCRRESYSRTARTPFSPNHTVCRLTAGDLPRSISNVLAATAHSSLLAHGTEKGGNDGRSCCKIVDVVGTSQQSISNAIGNAISKASGTLRNLGWFEVGQIAVISGTARLIDIRSR